MPHCLFRETRHDCGRARPGSKASRAANTNPTWTSHCIVLYMEVAINRTAAAFNAEKATEIFG